jgi:branched-chain amino acid transport system ATP-binding protein
MSETILSTKDLRKSFGNFMAVNGIKIDLQPNIITSIIGPNGAGKTTLINLITGILRPDKGKIFFKGEEITHLSTDKLVKKGITRSFQIMNIFPRLTVFENIELPVLSLLGKHLRWFSGTDDHRDVTEEVNKILEDVNLLDKRYMLAGELSHGDQRLLELAIAIARRPVICFLDEPSSGMNPSESGKVLELIKRFATAEKTTFVVVEHDMDLVFSLSDWIVVMNKGEILTEGEPGQIKENREVREIYLGEEL